MARSSAIVAFVLLSAMLGCITRADEDFEKQWGRDFLKGATKALEQIAENAKNSIEETKDEKESFTFPESVKPSSNDDPSFFVMDDVMEMLFHTSENVSHPYEPEYAAAEDAFKSAATDYWAELEKKMDVFSGHAESWWPISDSALEKIDKILASNGNATFDIVNGEIVFDHVSDDAIENNTVTSDVTGQQEDLMMTKKNSIPTTSRGPTSSFNITTVSPYGTQLSFYQELVDEGYLDQKSLDYFKSGIISEEELNHQLLTNKTYILAQFRPIFANMLEEKDHRIPEEVHVILFSGKLPLSELKWVVYKNGAISKALLPESLRQMLETRDPPHEVKEMLYDGYNDTQIMQRVMSNATILQKVMSASMYYMYTIFRQPQKRAINVALSAVAIVVLFFVMTSLGCTMTVAEIMRHVRRPKGVIIALVSQYGIMPAAAFGLTQIFHLDTYPAIAILICGCCPGGNLSNMLAFAINGDMNLSILMTTCSSVLGLGMMPLLLYCYSRFIIPIDGAELVPFDKIILNVALTIIPVSIGIAIKHYRPHWTKNVMRFGAVMLVLCSIAFGVLAGFLLGRKFFIFFPPEAVACSAILPLAGYIFGFLFARIAREDQKCSRTICVETGCQNVQLCGTILKLAFDPILVGVMILLPLIYMCFQTGEALLLVTLYRFYERCTGKKKKSIQDEDERDEEKKISRSNSEVKVSDEEEKKPLKTEKERNLTSDEKPSNGIEKNRSEEFKKGNIKHWPLVGTPPREYTESFKASTTET